MPPLQHARVQVGLGVQDAYGEVQVCPASPTYLRALVKSEHQRRMRMHRHVVNMMTIEDEMMVRWAGAVVEARRRLAYATGIQLPYSPFHAAQALAAPSDTKRTTRLMY